MIACRVPPPMIRRAAAATTLTLAAAGPAAARAQTPTVPAPPAPAPAPPRRAPSPAPPPVPAPVTTPPGARPGAGHAAAARRARRRGPRGPRGRALARARHGQPLRRGPAGDRPVLPRDGRAPGARRHRAPEPHGTLGQLRRRLRLRRSGPVTVRASHRATAAARHRGRAPGAGLRAAAATPPRAPSGPVVRLLQRGWPRWATSWAGAAATTPGRRAPCSRSARSPGWRGRRSPTSRRVPPARRRGGRFHVRYPRHGRHVEADLSRQVIALIGAAAKVERIYPIELRQAEHADDPRPLPRLLQDARDEREGHGVLQLLHPRLRDPRLRRRCRSTPRATAACGCRCPTRCRSSAGCASASASTSTA